jgi:solute carrier family 39 (zinc transporter), member 1/2/3
VSLVFYKASAAAIVFFISITAALYPLKRKHVHTRSLDLGDALASGIFLGAAFLHLLPHAITIFQSLYPSISYPIPEAICVGGFLLLLLLERLSLIHHFFHPSVNIPYVLALILVIHALTEGTALGVGTTFAESFMLFIAIIAHKGSASFALCIVLMRYQLPYRQIIALIIFFSLMTPLGIGIGSVISLFTGSRSGELMISLFNAFAAGTFIYISTLHHIHFHKRQEEGKGLMEFGALLTGVVMMGMIAWWA